MIKVCLLRDKSLWGVLFAPTLYQEIVGIKREKNVSIPYHRLHSEKHCEPWVVPLLDRYPCYIMRPLFVRCTHNSTFT
jgi:hypothetical protein